MAKYLIVIDFESIHPEKSIHRHTVRNFGEDLWREFRNDKWASSSLQEADKATNQLRVMARSTRWLRRTHVRVLELLEKHGLDRFSHVSVTQVQEDTRDTTCYTPRRAISRI